MIFYVLHYWCNISNTLIWKLKVNTDQKEACEFLWEFAARAAGQTGRWVTHTDWLKTSNSLMKESVCVRPSRLNPSRPCGPGHDWFGVKEREREIRQPEGAPASRPVSHLIISFWWAAAKRNPDTQTSALTGDSIQLHKSSSRRTVERKEETCCFKHVRDSRALMLRICIKREALKHSLWNGIMWKMFQFWIGKRASLTLSLDSICVTLSIFSMTDHQCQIGRKGNRKRKNNVNIQRNWKQETGRKENKLN